MTSLLSFVELWEMGAARAALSFGGVVGQTDPTWMMEDHVSPTVNRIWLENPDDGGWKVLAFLAGYGVVNSRVVIWLGKRSIASRRQYMSDEEWESAKGSVR